MIQRISKLVVLYSTLIMGLNICFAQDPDENKILWTANWSNDGNFIAIGGDDKKIKIYDGHTFLLIKTYENESEVKRVRWHPKKNLLAVAATDDGSKIIDVKSDRIIEFKDGDNIGGRAIAWNHNGELIAIADYGGKLSIWTKNGEHLKTIKQINSSKSYVAVDWHPSKNEIIVLGEDVVIYNVHGDVLKKFKHRNEKVLMLCIEWHKSGKLFVIGDYGGNIVPYKPLLQFWKSDGTLVRQIDISKAEFRNISWNKKGRRLATASDALRIWSKRGKLLKTGHSDDNLWGVDWSPNGKHIITSSHFGHALIWNKKGNIIKRLN